MISPDVYEYSVDLAGTAQREREASEVLEKGLAAFPGDFLLYREASASYCTLWGGQEKDAYAFAEKYKKDDPMLPGLACLNLFFHTKMGAMPLVRESLTPYEKEADKFIQSDEIWGRINDSYLAELSRNPDDIKLWEAFLMDGVLAGRYREIFKKLDDFSVGRPVLRFYATRLKVDAMWKAAEHGGTSDGEIARTTEPAFFAEYWSLMKQEIHEQPDNYWAMNDSVHELSFLRKYSEAKLVFDKLNGHWVSSDGWSRADFEKSRQHALSAPAINEKF